MDQWIPSHSRRTRVAAPSARYACEALERRQLLTSQPFTGLSVAGDAAMSRAVEIGKSTYFFAWDHVSTKADLWRTDGTTDGTVWTGISAARDGEVIPYALAKIDQTLLFVTAGAGESRDLWRTDGTPAGTSNLAHFALPGGATVDLDDMVVAGSQAFFVLTDATRGRELWRTDGTAAGTRLVRDIAAGNSSSNPASLTAMGSSVYFTANDRIAGTELWRSDGTLDGTSLVIDLDGAKTSSSPSDLYAANGLIYFAAFVRSGGVDTIGTEPWVTDGTAAGTRLLMDIHAGIQSSDPTEFVKFGDQVYFSANDGVHGRELWRTEGTGAVLAADILAGSVGGLITSMTVAGGHLFFVRTTSLNLLWTVSSPGADPVRLITPAAFPGLVVQDARAVGDKLVFSMTTDAAGKEFGVSDGTIDGTSLLGDLCTGALGSSPTALGTVGGKLLFAADDVLHGAAPWVTDGTSAGTRMLRRIASDLDPSAITVGTTVTAGSRLYALGGFPSAYLNRTVGAAWVVSDLEQGTFGSEPLCGTIESFLGAASIFYQPVGNSMYFGGAGVFFTDGTPAGTRQLSTASVTNPFVAGAQFQTAVVGQTLYFAIDPDQLTHEIWKTDGTASGTVRVKQFTSTSASLGPAYFQVLGDSLVFWAQDAAHGFEPWISDGTDVGTTILADVNPGTSSSALTEPTARVLAKTVGNTLYFGADDGFIHNGLWRTDGVTTTFVKDLLPGGGTQDASFAYPAVIGNDLFFFGYSRIDFSAVLWHTDGTPSGTTSIAASQINFDSLGLAAYNGNLYAINSTSLFQVTPAGMVTDIRKFDPSSERYSPFFTVASPDALYFLATDNHDRGIWKTDGTTQGTTLIDALALPSGHPGPFNGAHFGSSVWYQLDNGLRLALGPDYDAPTAQASLPAATPQDSPYVTKLQLKFSEFVQSGLSASDLVVRPLGSSSPVGEVRLLDYDTADNLATFGIGSLTPGKYRATLAAGSVMDKFGNTIASDLNYDFDVLPSVVSIVVNKGAAQRSKVEHIAVTFSGPVSLDAGAISLIGKNGAGSGTVVNMDSSDSTTFVLTFTGAPVVSGSLADGIYNLQIAPEKVHDLATPGQTMTAAVGLTLHRLFGDVNGDKTVNNADTFKLAAGYLKTASDPAFRYEFDYNADGIVNNADAFQFSRRYLAKYDY